MNFGQIYKSWASRRLEFRYLSDVMNKQKYWKEIEPIEKFLDDNNDLFMFSNTNGQDLVIQGL